MREREVEEPDRGCPPDGLMKRSGWQRPRCHHGEIQSMTLGSRVGTSRNGPVDGSPSRKGQVFRPEGDEASRAGLERERGDSFKASVVTSQRARGGRLGQWGGSPRRVSHGMAPTLRDLLRLPFLGPRMGLRTNHRRPPGGSFHRGPRR